MMSRVHIASALAALGVLTAGGAAFAADLPAYEPPAAVAAPVPSFTWTGGYLGVQAGYGWGRSTYGAAGVGSTRTRPEGFMLGGYAGYNYQFEGSGAVIGVETDLNWANIDDKKTIAGVSGKAETRWNGATRARLGYAFDRFLVYGAAGVAYADRKVSVSGFGSDKKTAVGWTVGGGVESALTENVVARAEYRYTDYGKDTLRLNGVSTNGGSYTEHRVMGGLAYKFGW